MSKTERETVARWIVRQRKDGTKYWFGRLAMDEGRFEQETLTCCARDFEVGTVIVCREPLVDVGEMADLKAQNESLLEALRAMVIVSDRGPQPTRLDAALTWRECDEKARAMADAAIAKALRNYPKEQL